MHLKVSFITLRSFPFRINVYKMYRQLSNTEAEYDNGPTVAYFTKEVNPRLAKRPLKPMGV